MQLKAIQFIIDNINTKRLNKIENINTKRLNKIENINTKRLNKIENMKSIVSMSVGKSFTLYNEGLD